MAQINENLIRKVFDEMVKYRPEYNVLKPLGESNFNILGDFVFNNFPYPVGVEIRRILAQSQLNHDRLYQMYKTIERTIQFTGFIMLSQLWNEKLKKGKSIEITNSFSEFLKVQFKELSLGKMIQLIREIIIIFKNNNIAWFIPEMERSFDKDFFKALDYWASERNDYAHFKNNFSPEEKCIKHEENLIVVLQKISFLAKYQLVSVREIKVKKTKKFGPEFQHDVGLMSGTSTPFIQHTLKGRSYYDSHSVLLLKTLQTVDEYLNLSPLIIVNNNTNLMYVSNKNDKLKYIGVDTKDKEENDLSNLDIYNNLKEEYEDLIYCFNQ
ncbi:MAG: hypothetical protein HY958_00215 [Bacteroidia bacterium]|nr:hypothetical protein [Bacteroidia bacterium]